MMSFPREPYCFHCQKESTALSRCSGCHVAWYCNSKCQAAHYKQHRKLCRTIATTTRRMEEEARMLGRTYFETHAGNFGEFEEARCYVHERCDLAEAFWRMASACDVRQVWEKALFHCLELLRLDLQDTGLVHLRTPFILLHLNRDDDAFDFIRYNSAASEQSFDYDEIVARYAHSKEGDWLYGRETNSRYQDIVDSCVAEGTPIAFQLALAIIKLRIVATNDATSRAIDSFFATAAGQQIHPVRSIVEEMLVDGQVDVEIQRQQANRLLDAIHVQHPSFLPAILNPAPIIGIPMAIAAALGYPADVFHNLRNGRTCFLRVPGAEDILKARFGPNPTYDPTEGSRSKS